MIFLHLVVFWLLNQFFIEKVLALISSPNHPSNQVPAFTFLDLRPRIFYQRRTKNKGNTSLTWFGCTWKFSIISHIGFIGNRTSHPILYTSTTSTWLEDNLYEDKYDWEKKSESESWETNRSTAPTQGNIIYKLSSKWDWQTVSSFRLFVPKSLISITILYLCIYFPIQLHICPVTLILQLTSTNPLFCGIVKNVFHVILANPSFCKSSHIHIPFSNVKVNNVNGYFLITLTNPLFCVVVTFVLHVSCKSFI